MVFFTPLRSVRNDRGQVWRFSKLDGKKGHFENFLILQLDSAGCAARLPLAKHPHNRAFG